jgi:RNA-directed DNA polymerase
MIGLDQMLSEMCQDRGWIYTRYADDLFCSTHEKTVTRRDAVQLVRSTFQCLALVGLTANRTKTHIVPPGARKIVLGLVVNSPRPTLPRKLKDSLRQHLHYLGRADVGPALHARHRGFTAIAGLREHIRGLIAFAGQVDPTFASNCRQQFEEIKWPV